MVKGFFIPPLSVGIEGNIDMTTTTKTKTQTIRCISKDDRKNPYERIINVGGLNPNGDRWKQSQQKTIRKSILASGNTTSGKVATA